MRSRSTSQSAVVRIGTGVYLGGEHLTVQAPGNRPMPPKPVASDPLIGICTARMYNFCMRIQTYSETRAHLAETMTSIIEDQDEVVITRAGQEPVVMLPLSEYESIKETAYLLRSPANARRLREAIARVEAGQAEPHELIEE